MPHSISNAAALHNSIRALGPVIDPPATHAFYQDRSQYKKRHDVHVQKDVAYGDDDRHKMDVYWPTAHNGTLPIVMFVHGGGFIRGDKAERCDVGAYFAHHGFLTVVINYRLAPQHPWPAGAEDVATAVGWVQRQAVQWQGNGQQLFVIGESAGAVHVATSSLITRFGEAAKWRYPLAGIALISGPYDVLLDLLAQNAFRQPQPDPFNGAYYGKDTASWSSKSTVDKLDAAPFPLFISYAELDPPQMQVQAGAMVAALVKQHGFSPCLEVIRNHNHLSQIYSINTQDDALGQPLLSFLLSHYRFEK